MSSYTGKEFNHKFKGIKFVKLTNCTEKHNGFQFKTGINVDHLRFNPHGTCEPGGLYFCRESELYMWINYGKQHMVYCRYVTIPDNAQVYDEGNKFKADRFILSKGQLIGTLPVWYNRQFLLNLHNKWENPKHLLANFSEETLNFITSMRSDNYSPCEFYLSWVKTNGLFLEYVDFGDRTDEICLAAVQQNPWAFEFVVNKTEKICLAAIERNPHVLYYLTEQTPELCLTAAKLNGLSLMHAKYRTAEICLAAVQNAGIALMYVDEKTQTPEICLAAVQQNGDALKYVHLHSPRICLTAIKQKSQAIQWIKPEIIELGLSRLVSQSNLSS
jgi:hypothetical protein